MARGFFPFGPLVCVCRLYSSKNFLVLFTKHILHLLIGRHICLQVSLIVMYIPPVYEVYRGYIVFVFSVIMFVCVWRGRGGVGGGGVVVCKRFVSSKISYELLNLGF